MKNQTLLACADVCFFLCKCLNSLAGVRLEGSSLILTSVVADVDKIYYYFREVVINDILERASVWKTFLHLLHFSLHYKKIYIYTHP